MASVLFHDCAVKAAVGESDPWHNSLRVKRIQGTPRRLGDDVELERPRRGATWQWTEIDGEPAILWRRVGTQAVFDKP